MTFPDEELMAREAAEAAEAAMAMYALEEEEEVYVEQQSAKRGKYVYESGAIPQSASESEVVASASESEVEPVIDVAEIEARRAYAVAMEERERKDFAKAEQLKTTIKELTDKRDELQYVVFAKGLQRDSVLRDPARSSSSTSLPPSINLDAIRKVEESLEHALA